MEYRIIRSNRKTMALEITPLCEILVRAPINMPQRTIEDFVNKHQTWIVSNLNKQQERRKNMRVLNSDEIANLKKKAKEILPDKVEYFSRLTGLKPTGLKITSAKKRFGSCNGKNSICFSYILMQYPDSAIDYVVLHEIAHIKHHNHSKNFWAFVQKYMPDYKEKQKLLKNLIL